MSTTPVIITPAEARKEIARRKAPVGSAKRNRFPAPRIFNASTKQLRAALTPAPKPAPAPLSPALVTNAARILALHRAAKKAALVNA